MKDRIDVPFFVHGGDYNPEQWKDYSGILEKDIELMKESRCNTMTIGIFAWDELEPSDGTYDFSFFDKVIAMLKENGIYFILATPSASRPRWLAEKYPEVLRTCEDGVKMRYGERHNHCYSSPAYRKKVAEIDELLSKRYGNDDHLLAWHISNEFGGACYCDLCKEEFKKLVKNRYHGDINELNHAYWAAFWGHKYNSFDQIDPPGAHGDNSLHGLSLDWKRFVTDRTVDFMRCEIDAVKKYSDKPVTTNMMFGFTGLNYYEFAPYIDFASWDNYPDWHSQTQTDVAAKSAFWHDFYRSLKNAPFMMMESAPGLTNWKPVNKLKRPGMDELAAIQAIAHGSDSVQYFQWRKSRGSSEKFHGAVVDHVGTNETRVFKAVKRTGEVLERLSEIKGSGVEAQVAIIFDWENMWAFEQSQQLEYNKDYRNDVYEYYKVFWENSISCDIVNLHADLSKYKLVVAVEQYMVDRAAIDNIVNFVKNGGVILATYETGYVNETDLCYLGGFPAEELKDVFGIWNEEIDTLYPEESFEIKYGKNTYKGGRWMETVRLKGAKTLAERESEFDGSTPCLTVNKFGDGYAYYNACKSDEAFKKAFIKDILDRFNINSLAPIKDGVDHDGVVAHKRVKDGTEYTFVENYSDKPFNAALDGEYYDMVRGETVKSVDLNPFGFAVLKKN